MYEKFPDYPASLTIGITVVDSDECRACHPLARFGPVPIALPEMEWKFCERHALVCRAFAELETFRATHPSTPARS